ncbi:MAG: hypothetical protein COT92_02420 [Candidatus Doudnabacteria bacterium CG10_big_fil_rev_8_21_14_0_10_42_18]|uniref:NADPH-dependent FMN reductase-like domain-containing protein n=1 Tax=Candidatus Doudnabacteria bacterium CG10_big_fil_rev_8_21_14_0_10_42_18 TaxID=1974552 RepID=A0A2H0VAS8_9BACT|nr:MAG: hypothetical protein COT92_02420 [Candidatus Doudnabacteria bacterium CG10_big_fil_rev_8_21_14_0_10_42_18]
MKLNIPVVLGSVRQKRRSIHPANWMVEQIRQAGHNTQLVDFAELPLPFFDSESVPVALKGKYPNENAQKWSNAAQSADAFVLIVPEYNHGYSAVMKNALDWLYMEFTKKPFGMVGVSDGSFGGIRAIEQLRQVIENFGAFAIRETVNFGMVQDKFSESGELLDQAYIKRAERFLNALVFFAEAMKKAREK